MALLAIKDLWNLNKDEDEYKINLHIFHVFCSYLLKTWSIIISAANTERD
jgi:hypothetical protein